ncbi:MAG: TrmH family RNA methyltransferase, partial [Acidimicrobiales bacterium]
TELKRLHRTWRRSSDVRLALILDGVQKPYNVGSILRSAAAYAVEEIWAVPPTPGLDDRGVAKTALGSAKFASWRTATSGPEAVQAAKAAGYTTVAIELCTGAEPLFELDLGRAVCLVLGHEDRGVHRDTLAAVDHAGYLPQLGRIGSLNVAHAGTAALYEIAAARFAR